MNLIVTTAHKPSDKMSREAAQLAEALGTILVERGNYSLNKLKDEFAAEILLVLTQKGPVAVTGGGEYFFHLSMAELRIKNLINGKHDHMMDAMALQPGMTVLDCTLGLATDAVVASYISGVSGQVTGLEASPIISTITGWGLQKFNCDNGEVTEALRRIRVLNADYNTYLPTVADNSFDIVYFDPMFRAPIKNSSNIKPIRFLADDRPLNAAAVEQARRIAEHRVVIKEANNSREFLRLGISSVYGGKYSSVQYGVIGAGD